MTFYRHFMERNDFETLVITNNQQLSEFPVNYEPIHIAEPDWWRRLCHSRLAPWAYGLEYLFGGELLPNFTNKRIETFQPELVFTVAGSWHWTALAAQIVARRCGVPLVASFNDWFDYGSFNAHQYFRPYVESRFRRFYLECDLALCTSEGMREALGPHPNSHILYPTGAPLSAESKEYCPQLPEINKPLTIFFGGSLGDWYGPMLESLITNCRFLAKEIQFRIYGSLQTWSEDFDNWAKAEAIFGGHLSFAKLREAAEESDILLLPMGFGESCAQVESTSFKTKFLDYLAFRRPILIWGPEYCSAVRAAKQYDSAECVTEPGVEKCVASIRSLIANPRRRAQLIANARRMYEDRFHPDKIHSGLVDKCNELVQRRSRPRLNQDR